MIAGPPAFAGSPSIPTFDFGNADACWPVTGDWNGDDTDTIGVACRGTGGSLVWHLMNVNSGGTPPQIEGSYGNADTCRPITGDWDANNTDTIGIACNGHSLTWGLMNVHTGGTPQIQASYGGGDSYQPTGGWGGPTWPTWPTHA